MAESAFPGPYYNYPKIEGLEGFLRAPRRRSGVKISIPSSDTLHIPGPEALHLGCSPVMLTVPNRDNSTPE